MYLDASVIISILQGVPEAEGYLAAIETTESAGKKLFTSSISRFEAASVLAVQRFRGRQANHASDEDLAQAEELVDDFLREVGCRDILISEGIGRSAFEAWRKYGRLTRHPAQLTMSDCYAYACAKGYHVRMLATGQRFAQTDLR